MKPAYWSASRSKGLVIVLGAAISLSLLIWIGPSSLFAYDPPQSSSSDSPNRLSDAFTKPATSALIAIHQAKQNIANVVAKNLPTGYYDPNLAAQAYDLVRQSQIAATTDADQRTASLINSYFMKVKTWAETYKSDRESMNASRTMGENMLARDQGWQAISNCEAALNTMLSKRVYTDTASCQ